jgi:hypothetical protein
MTSTIHVGKALAFLVPASVRSKMRWRTVNTGEDLGLGKEVAVVQIGPSAPYRILVLEMGSDDLVSYQVFQANGKMKVVKTGKAMSDLVGLQLEKLVDEFNLSA